MPEINNCQCESLRSELANDQAARKINPSPLKSDEYQESLNNARRRSLNSPVSVCAGIGVPPMGDNESSPERTSESASQRAQK